MNTERRKNTNPQMKLSVACNFDEELIKGLSPYPVYEVYGKLTTDAFGGGRPSFYLPEVTKKEVEKMVKLCHSCGIEFNYLLNASCMGNTEFTKQGQRKLNEMLEWLSKIGVDSITVATLHFLRMIKKRYPHFKVRISSHRFTDTPRKIRFWQDNGADCIVISEVNIYREFKILEAMRKAAEYVDLQLIVNNSCRQDCVIAGTHAETLNHASQNQAGGFPLDYCQIFCMNFKLTEPVNYLRANWIRPEDLHYYMEMGYNNFKIVERNTPTKILLERTKAYYEQRYDGNLLDLVQNHAYQYEKFSRREHDAYSLKRMIKYFSKPRSINMTKFIKVMELGKRASLLYPRIGENEIYIDNRALDGFIERFRSQSCQDIDCEECRYCHEWADKVVRINPNFDRDMRRIYRQLLDELHSGTFWEPYHRTALTLIKKIFTSTMKDGMRKTFIKKPADQIIHLIEIMPAHPVLNAIKKFISNGKYVQTPQGREKLSEPTSCDKQSTPERKISRIYA